MKLGLLSDTHGHLGRTELALRMLKDAGAAQLIHCGDLGSEEVLSLLLEQQESGLPVTAVPGNVDDWDPGLILYGKKIGIPLPRLQRIEIEGLHVAIHHGHDAALMQNLMAEMNASENCASSTPERFTAPTQRGFRCSTPGAGSSLFYRFNNHIIYSQMRPRAWSM
jgi:putative phosphoesterase